MEYTAEWQEYYQKRGTALCGAAVLPLVILVAAGGSTGGCGRMNRLSCGCSVEKEKGHA